MRTLRALASVATAWRRTTLAKRRDTRIHLRKSVGIGAHGAGRQRAQQAGPRACCALACRRRHMAPAVRPACAAAHALCGWFRTTHVAHKPPMRYGIGTGTLRSPVASRLDRGQGHARSHELFKNYGAVRIRIQLERELSKPQKTRVQFFGARPWQHLKPLASEGTRLQYDNETAQRTAKPTVSSGSSSSDPTCRQVATAYMATHPAPAPMRGYGQVQPFAAAMRERRIHMP